MGRADQSALGIIAGGVVSRSIPEPEPEQSSPDEPRNPVDPKNRPPGAKGQNQLGGQDRGQHAARPSPERDQATGKGPPRERHPQAIDPCGDGVSSRLTEANKQPSGEQGHEPCRQSCQSGAEGPDGHTG